MFDDNWQYMYLGCVCKNIPKDTARTVANVYRLINNNDWANQIYVFAIDQIEYLLGWFTPCFQV